MARLSAAERHTVRLTLNGRAVEARAEPRMLLTDFLRHELGATGTHVGCEHGVCGACTILFNGEAARLTMPSTPSPTSLAPATMSTPPRAIAATSCA